MFCKKLKKDCLIEYKKVAMNETVQVYHTPTVKDWNFQDLRIAKQNMKLCVKQGKNWAQKI